MINHNNEKRTELQVCGRTRKTMPGGSLYILGSETGKHRKPDKIAGLSKTGAIAQVGCRSGNRLVFHPSAELREKRGQVTGIEKRHGNSRKGRLPDSCPRSNFLSRRERHISTGPSSITA